MRLKRLRLSGFKSFCDDTEFEFGGQGVNVVLGPNGCGKSNVVDAIRWALGEQSPKQLRGGAMGDVIFGGSTARKPIGRCEVTLTFENTDGDAPEQYREFSEIAVTRRLYRTGESEYLINGMTCRLMDIRDLVMDTGAAGHAYAIVEQGRVEQFITASPAERRIFVEEAAGVVRYRTRRAAAEKKLEQTDQNLMRVNDLLGELRRQEDALRGQVAQAEAYASLRDEVQALAAELARARYRRAEQACGDLEARHTAAAGEHESHLQAIQLLEVQWERLQNDQSLLEAQLKRTRAAFYDRQRQAAQVESRLALERQNRLHTEQWIAELEARLTELRGRAEALAAERADGAGRLGGLQTERAGLERTICEAEREFAEKEAAAREVAERLQTLQEQLLECHTTLTGQANQRRFLGERIEEWSRREIALDARFRAGDSEHRQARAKQDELTARGAALDAETRAAAEREDDLAGQIAAKAEALAKANEALAAARAAESEARSRLTALAEVDAAHEGLEEPVRHLLAWADGEPGRREQLGILGPLAEFVRVPDETLAWAGAALAPLLDLVVVRRAAAIPGLHAAIEREGMGRVRLAPLDALAGPGGPGTEAAAVPAADSLAAHVSLEGELAPLGPALFGGIRRLPDGRGAYPRPDAAACTEWLAADGRFHLDHRGAVAMGEAAAPELAVLRRRNELSALEQRVTAEAERAAGLAAGSEQAAERHAALAAEREALQQSRQALALEQSALAQQVQHATAEVERLARAQESLRTEREQTAQDLARAREQQIALEHEARAAQNRREALEQEATTVREASQSARDAATALGEALTGRKVALGQAQSREEHLQARLAAIGDEAAALTTRGEEAEGEIAGQRERLTGHGHAIESATAELARLQEAQGAEQGAVNDLQRRFEAGEQQRVGLAGRLKAAQGERDASQGTLHGLEKALAVEQLRMEQAAELLGEAPAPSPELAGLDEPELERRWKGGSTQLERMGAVNLAAPEEHGAIQERLTFLEAQKSDLEAACEDLRESIRRMNHESRRRFKDAFEQVNATFQRVFPEVFGGGEARLLLTDSEDLLMAGVDIVAQPPGKKLQNLSLLSGGEKALTAIALIFSFFLIKPSPFCLLDEVDAPLDDANVGRFNRLVRSMTDRTQFIIITHNRRTMESGNQLFGVTMEEAGVSKVVSVELAGPPA